LYTENRLAASEQMMMIPMKTLAVGGWLFVLLTANRASAHYHILLPDKASVERGTSVKFTLRFGHPFEHQMFPTAKPTSVTVVTPDGEKVDLSASPVRAQPRENEDKAASGYCWTYTPGHRGDHVVLVRCEPQWMAEEKEFLEDSVKTILHVQTQNGWDATVGDGMELIPLTRPYGLRAGTVFQVSVQGKPAPGASPPQIIFPTSEHQPLPGILVEVERYNAMPPKALPADEFITRTVKTDPNGVATVTLPEPGWWAITAIREGGTRMRDGNAYPVKVRSTLWVPVDEAK
jgi:cobalt/nickel transport protein